MASAPSTPAAHPAERIDAALARVEAALKARASEADAMTRRHAALKARMAEAVEALDAVLSRGPA